MQDSNNNHIVEFLNYYTSLTISPEYAVLIRGKWGSGKSWFIKNFMKRNIGYEYLYVSLYGVTSFKDVEDSFFQQLHPVLASKGMKLAGKILKGVLKTTIKVDLDKDGKEEGSVTSGVPDINLPDFLKNIDSRILIFDDLERCSIAIPSILGYINQFVETNGLKVILIANEEEIIKQDEKEKNIDSTKAYLTIKEKLIGKSFEVQSDFDSALEVFIDEIKDQAIRHFLEKKKNIIKEIYSLAGYENLRHLRQSILDFERFYSLLPSIAKEKEVVIEHIMKLFFSLSFEIKKGLIKEDELVKLFSIDHYTSKAETKTISQIIREKYPIYGVYHHPVNHTVFTPFFKLGLVKKDEVKESVQSSIYFQDERTPNWARLWYYFDLEDDDFSKIFELVYSDFKEMRIMNKYELVQVVGLLLRLSDENLISQQKNAILEIGKRSIDNLKKNGNLQLSKNEGFPSDHSHGLSYQGSKILEFQQFLRYAEEQAKNSQISNYPQLAQELLSLMKTSIDQFEERVTISNSRNNIYYDTPILVHVNVKDFTTTFLNLPNKWKKELGWALENRYKYREFNDKLKEELPWLKKVFKRINNLKGEYSGKVSGYIIEHSFLKSLNKCIAILENKHVS